MYESVFEGVRFIEGRPERTRLLEPLSVQIGGVFQSAQLKNLDDVKKIMAGRVLAAGGNAVVDFKYGQKSVGFWSSLFQRDDVNWHGSGMIAIVS